MKQKTKNGKPRGASFADVLAHKRQMRAAVEKAAADKMVEVRSEIAVQRILWLAVASVADAYGFGAKRLDLFFRALDENTREYQRLAERKREALLLYLGELPAFAGIFKVRSYPCPHRRG